MMRAAATGNAMPNRDPHCHIHKLPAGTDLVALHQKNPERYPFLLASTAKGGNGHFSILFGFPGERLSLYFRDGRFELESGSRRLPVVSPDDRFLTVFEQWFRAEQTHEAWDPALPFTGGWFVYLGYELAREIEPVLELPMPAANEPVASMVRCPAAVIHNHQTGEILSIAENDYKHCLATVANDAAAAVPAESRTGTCLRIEEGATAPYLSQVRRIKEYIVEGDIFQANLSRRWHARLSNGWNNAGLFNRLAASNPGAFAALVQLGDATIVSSSPERLVSARNGIVETRPIAGTRPRSSDREEDARLAAELLAHPKEQAEHIMLIDLERNDLGRICIPGSIAVNELMVLESYQHVHHIVSNVRGRLQPGRSPADIIRAVFPGGTITGCPKVRCMEILAELEAEPRGAYTGSVGYINRNGDMDLNILIRTLVRRGHEVTLRAGGGIVADSDPDKELEETRAKASGMLHALGAVA